MNLEKLVQNLKAMDTDRVFQLYDLDPGFQAGEHPSPEEIILLTIALGVSDKKDGLPPKHQNKLYLDAYHLA
ncbi:MAG: hypothetical protein MUE44_34760 [Oscillatoriaceae cyanobacterium Prado104]|jgi:hypothetical protein|nr:hypothetical protein [Oscillatoriaceae cyanobacterium Prado104]